MWILIIRILVYFRNFAMPVSVITSYLWYLIHYVDCTTQNLFIYILRNLFYYILNNHLFTDLRFDETKNSIILTWVYDL